MIGLCGLSSWDAPISVQWIVVYCPLRDWLSGAVVYAQVYELRVVGSNRGSTMLWRFFAISPLAKLLVQPNGSIVIAIVIGGGEGGGSPHFFHPCSAGDPMMR